MAEQQSLNHEIAQIEQQLAKKRDQLRSQQEAGEIENLPTDKEVLNEAVQEHISDDAPVQNDPGTAVTDDNSDLQPEPDEDTPSYMTPELHEHVQELVNDAFSGSISDAAAKARDTKNPALMDAFHDALVDQLYDHLVEQGKLKKIED